MRLENLTVYSDHLVFEGGIEEMQDFILKQFPTIQNVVLEHSKENYNDFFLSVDTHNGLVLVDNNKVGNFHGISKAEMMSILTSVVLSRESQKERLCDIYLHCNNAIENMRLEIPVSEAIEWVDHMISEHHLSVEKYRGGVIRVVRIENGAIEYERGI